MFSLLKIKKKDQKKKQKKDLEKGTLCYLRKEGMRDEMISEDLRQKVKVINISFCSYIMFSFCLLPGFWNPVKGGFGQKLNTVWPLRSNFFKRREPIKQLQLFSCWMENVICKVSVLLLYYHLHFLKNESY